MKPDTFRVERSREIKAAPKASIRCCQIFVDGRMVALGKERPSDEENPQWGRKRQRSGLRVGGETRKWVKDAWKSPKPETGMIRSRLNFEKPMVCENQCEFKLERVDDGRWLFGVWKVLILYVKVDAGLHEHGRDGWEGF